MELTAAFEQAVAVRSRGREVREVADRYFQETAVRLHRVARDPGRRSAGDRPAERPGAVTVPLPDLAPRGRTRIGWRPTRRSRGPARLPIPRR